jgi:hypothetical protein
MSGWLQRSIQHPKSRTLTMNTVLRKSEWRIHE